MELYLQLPFQNNHEGMDDGAFYAKELELAVWGEELGFQGLCAPEHHFSAEYCMCPDNTQLLSYLAGRTERVKLITAAVILPWWDQPLRVAEKLVMLDHMSDGRLVVGFGRGLARREYEQFNIDMNESRARFDEAADLVLRALDTGVASGDGPFFPQPEAVLHPAPTRGFRDRLMIIAMSPDSLDVAARLGGSMSTFIQNPIEMHAPMIEQWREGYRTQQGSEPPAPTLTEFMYCHEDPDVAEANARRYITQYYLTAIRHYEFGGKHFEGTTGYAAYAEYADMLRELGNDSVADAFVKAQTWGTPEQILERIEERMSVIGDYNLNGAFSYGGMPYEVVESSMKLYAEAVIPKAREMGAVVKSV